MVECGEWGYKRKTKEKEISERNLKKHKKYRFNLYIFKKSINFADFLCRIADLRSLL